MTKRNRSTKTLPWVLLLMTVAFVAGAQAPPAKIRSPALKDARLHSPMPGGGIGGWYGDTGSGRSMSETHAPFWVHGAGLVSMRLSSPMPLQARLSVDERPSVSLRIARPVLVRFRLDGNRWHLLSIDVPHLVAASPKKVGIRLEALSFARR